MFDKNSITLSKTDYLLYRDCKRNAWIKIHKPDVYSEFPLSEFEVSLMESGYDVELIARQLFPGGILIEEFGAEGKEVTKKHLLKKELVLFQPVFIMDGFQAKVDVLRFNPKTNGYSIYEIKSKNEIDQKTNPYDLAFQVNLLRKCGLKMESINLIHLNKEYLRLGNLNVNLLFKNNDLTDEINGLCEEVAIDMDSALEYLSQGNLIDGSCSCIYKGRSNHCTTFSISNPHIPKYSVHDIVRIGSSKAKLAELIDGNIFEINDVPLHIKLSPAQQNQISAHKLDRVLINKEVIKSELKNLEFPLYFLDYETFPSAIPKFDGYSPYMQIPFQYSLHVLKSPTDELEHLEFIHTDSDDPTKHLIKSLQKHVGTNGSIIVWFKNFECSVHNKIAERLPEAQLFMESLNNRVYDLMDIFSKQHYVHKEFRGSTSIKNVLPVLIPELSYKDLVIQEGTTAFLRWNELITENLNKNEKEEIIKNLKIYCGQDSLAMYKIWKHLDEIAS